MRRVLRPLPNLQRAIASGHFSVDERRCFSAARYATEYDRFVLELRDNPPPHQRGELHRASPTRRTRSIQSAAVVRRFVRTCRVQSRFSLADSLVSLAGLRGTLSEMREKSTLEAA